MESENVSTKVTQDERILAALAHASVILPFWGLIGAIVVWATQREKSRFVNFQALQGAAYQLCLIILAFIGGACYMIASFGMFLMMPAGLFAVGDLNDPNAMGGVIAMLVAIATSFLPFCLMGIFFLIGAAFVCYGLYGAVRVLQGHDFRYAIIGSRLEQYLSQGEEEAAA
jgi:uncharacterized Tic20 family protein